MKSKIFSFIFFVLCLGVFLSFRFLAIFSKDPTVAVQQPRPYLPKSVAVEAQKVVHPWLAMQPNVKATDPIQADLQAFDGFCSEIAEKGDFSFQDVRSILMNALTNLQEQIPFDLPNTYYSVISIPETDKSFRIFKRLYLGETALGMPFYLDVRVFDLSKESTENIIQRHLSQMEGKVETLVKKGDHQAYICTGNVTDPKRGHGFAEAQGKRAFYIHCVEKDGQLFMAYAEAPINTFSKHEPFFRSLSLQ